MGGQAPLTRLTVASRASVSVSGSLSPAARAAGAPLRGLLLSEGLLVAGSTVGLLGQRSGQRPFASS